MYLRPFFSGKLLSLLQMADEGGEEEGFVQVFINNGDGHDHQNQSNKCSNSMQPLSYNGATYVLTRPCYLS